MFALPAQDAKQMLIRHSIHLRQDFVDLLIRGFFALQFQRKGDIGAHGKLVQHVVFLKDKADEDVIYPYVVHYQ